MEDKKLLYNLFQAYYDARKNKRSTINALAFEIDYESKLFLLYNEIKTETYKIGKSICFISFKPVKREIFAADFRDRIVHHLIYNYISPIFERLFLNDIYSCRIGKGTLYGIKRLNHFICSCSKNYKQDCYVLKLDIKGYFMSIDKHILYKKIENTLKKQISFSFHPQNNILPISVNIAFILRLIYKIIFNDPTKNCKIKGNKENWQGLPKSKSLFFSKENKGLPIGNLTSQLFANIYLNEFDHFVKYKLACKYYGRYVDDIVIVHTNKEYLKKIIIDIKKYLKEELLLELHPKKIYLQHFSKGVAFLGAIIKPYRIYIKNKTKGEFYKKIQYWKNFKKVNNFYRSREVKNKFLSSINSYLGLMKKYNTIKLRKKMLIKDLLPHFYPYVYTLGNYGKICSII